MNTDIRLSIGWNRHPKIVKLRRKLGAEGVMGLIGLWTFCGESRTDGVLHGMDDDDIAIAGDYHGDAAVFVATLSELKLLDRAGNDWAIHDWSKNNPWACGHQARSEKAKKAIQARWDRQKKPSKDPEKCLEDTPSTESDTRSIEKHSRSNTPLLSSPLLSYPKEKDPSTDVDVRPLAAASGPAEPPRLRSVKPPCPFDAIRELYHEILPELRQCRVMTDTRKGYIRQRWNDWPGPDLERWRKYFGYVRDSAFLMGKKGGHDGRPPFECDLEWLTKPGNCAKVREGKYHHHEVAARG